MKGNDPLGEFREYLPRYLSEEGIENLFYELSLFPGNIDQRFYTAVLKEEAAAFQGDGVSDLPAVQLPEVDVHNIRALILSNTCDMDVNNKRLVAMRVVYTPIVSLSKLESGLRRGGFADNKVSDYLSAIRKQRISNAFYLPAGSGLNEEAVAFLDRALNCSLKELYRVKIADRRLFSLSDYGFYVFLFKISLHFCRVREAVKRS